ncbi:MAG: ABC transporter ATP-binding protein [Nanoarchaeota archaeon]
MDRLLLQVEDISTSHGKFKISSVSFRLKNGDIFGLVGRSGSGKSTLLKTIIGLKFPDYGKISVYLNNNQVELGELIGYSPQDNSLYPFLTIEENIRTFGSLYKIEKGIIEERANVLLRRLDLEKNRRKKITELSGGMQKRADLAVTLIHAPKILVLDEPFSGLDVSLQSFIWKFLKELSLQGRIIIISSHILSDIQKNCNEFGLIEKGAFFNTSQIAQTLRNSREKSLEFFLERLFTKDLMQEE